MKPTDGKDEVIEVLKQANKGLRTYVDELEKEILIKMGRIKELEKAIGVCVPSIIRCFIATASDEDKELAEKVLLRVNKAIEK